MLERYVCLSPQLVFSRKNAKFVLSCPLFDFDASVTIESVWLLSSSSHSSSLTITSDTSHSVEKRTIVFFIEKENSFRSGFQ